MKNEHTPTPWMHSNAGRKMSDEYSQPFAIVQNSDKPTLIAGCFGDVRGGQGVAKANAAHIVKCVNSHDELLAALRNMISVGSEFYDMDMGEAGYAAIEQSYAAIAKAEAQ